ncbi:Cys-Gln thioester bond-forming surface protein [Massilimaliae timonensis]|uniref:Cys-Gln thioester bond-forming surface protein n=1 Tax=Massiliimalia timonensis TaxID=1987501 RepID=A0A8J6P260_9FIRM|nr:SpaA isopeptide-forming pilin-related protein [Massiliimalia timonensis]MBC8611494.1 Cys-Gln thioester bond-forming surface protein [Massiliimalia timonensis]
MKKHLKRLLSMMMAVLLCFGIFPSSAFAKEYEYDGYISMIDHKSRGYSLSSNLPAPFGGYSSDKFTELRINDLINFRTAYCIQFSVGVHTGIGYDQSDDYAAFTAEQKAMINTALTLGYNVETGTKYGGSAIDEYIATQILIWLIAHGQLGTGYETQIVNEFTANSPAAKPIFYQLRENVVNYHTIPSFATDDPSAVGAYTHDLKYNESNGKNETTLVDENHVLGNFAVSYPGVDFSVSGNQLRISTDKKEFGTITAEKRLPSSVPGVVTGGTKYWLRDEYQNVVTFDVEGSAEPVKCYFSLEIKAGTLQLVKTSEDGEVSGIPFHISGGGIEKDVVTGPEGTIRVDNLQAGNYTVTEQAPDKYVQPESQQVTIYPGRTSSVNFSNILKKFTVEMEKVDSVTGEAQGDSTLDGAVYGLFKGETLLDTYTTANGGKFTTKEYPCGPDYSIREISPSEGYLLDETVYPVGAEPGNFTLENNSIPMTATEDVILGSIAITKHTDQPAIPDLKEPAPQSDAPAEESNPAESVPVEDVPVEEPAESNSVEEAPTSSSSGISESTPVPEDADASSSQPEESAESGPTAESAEEPSPESSPAPESEPQPAPSVSSVPEIIPAAASLASNASILPLSTTASHDEVQIEQPEEGAEFQIYLASAGSYENAKESERDLLITDSHGFAKSKSMPYGLYVVHQTKGAAGQKFVPDFSVFISEHGKTYYFILNNPTFTSLIRFEKKDLESGKIIPLAGTAVKIKNADTGEWVVQHLNYPSPIDIDTFVTDSTGTLMLPQPLPFGNYELFEQQSPWGYVFDGEPVPFVVDGTQDVVTVEKYNIPQKGTITVSKEGEVFSHVAESGGMYQPQYEVQGQPGAVYDITALEDIVTPDGTVHLKAGELVTTLTTGSDGIATSEPLYLGRYQILERTAPDGMVVDPEPEEVTLSYAGQEVEITSASVGFVNERQKVEISLKKLLEQDETFSIGMNEEWKNITFGLFAAEQLTASDGTSIPADGLMETIGIDENGNAVFKTDVPCGASLYVKEIGTDDHYILSDKKYPVVFEYGGQDVTKVQIQVNNGEAIENTLKRGKVSGWKVDQDGFELAGAKIGLFCFDETEFTEETAFLVTESNPIGYFEFDKVPVGNWLVREIAPPAAFILTEETFPVEITEDGQTIEITIENQIIKGTAETTKVDADFPENKLSGAVFEVYADVDNNGEFDAEIDKLAGEMAETEPGLYQMKNLVYGNYFLHEKESPEFFQRDENYYLFSITENEAVVRIETEAGVGFLNKAQTGSLKVVKTADDDSIEGRTFKITGTDFMGNPYEQEFQTDEKGEIHVTLRVGEYTVSEVAGEDAEKYILPDDQTIEIKAGETTTVKMHNKLVPEVPTVPQTGDHPWTPAVLIGLSVLAVLSAGGLLVLRFAGKKKKATVDEDQGAEE